MVTLNRRGSVTERYSLVVPKECVQFSSQSGLQLLSARCSELGYRLSLSEIGKPVIEAEQLTHHLGVVAIVPRFVPIVSMGFSCGNTEWRSDLSFSSPQ